MRRLPRISIVHPLELRVLLTSSLAESCIRFLLYARSPARPRGSSTALQTNEAIHPPLLRLATDMGLLDPLGVRVLSQRYRISKQLLQTMRSATPLLMHINMFDQTTLPFEWTRADPVIPLDEEMDRVFRPCFPGRLSISNSLDVLKRNRQADPRTFSTNSVRTSQL